ncbi:exonuclease subunit SbcD [Pseudobutyrivibrio ruminis]|uniref:metallophosphoesterase family protein n=1 Tax=Pseudobutyrivibrio ruminis TaxID=46206 RepID=UPI000AB3E8FB|nr:exonuclease subunit SbcD [Pseudobutyrivibrio ruminis]
MKLFHISDLHLGKKVNEFSMIEDQKYILKLILTYVNEEKPDGILIAGDVYDRSIPSEEAMKLWDEFFN